MKIVIHSVLMIAGTLVASIILNSTVQAHVLITDTSGDKGAILHIIPDDEPIAGEEAFLFLDTQGGLLDDMSVVKFSVTQQDSDVSVDVPVAIEDSLVTAKYIFPTRGVYTLEYEIATRDKQFTFTQSTRITKGVASGGSSTKSYPWAEGVLFAATGLLLIFAIVFWNRRRTIAQQSTL